MRIPSLAMFLLATAMLAACAKPIPPEKAAYVGDWESPNMAVAITQDGRVSYKRQEGGMSKSVEGPLQAFDGDDFSVGIGMLSTRFVVAAPPHLVDGSWRMTVDGVELTKQP